MRKSRRPILITSLWFFSLGFSPIDGLTQSSDRAVLWREAREAVTPEERVRAYDQLVRRFRDPAAMNNLGTMYKHGTGVSRDVRMAVSLWERSIEFGHERLDFGTDESNLAYRGSPAVSLGFTYLTGVSPEIEPDSRRALEWNLRGSRLGHTNAYSNLALIYVMGFGVDRDYASAVSYLIKSVETYTDHTAWLLRQSDEWEEMVKDAPPEIWRARQLYWTALRTGDKQSSIKQMRTIEMALRGVVTSSGKKARTVESIVKECLRLGFKPGTSRFSDCIAGG